MNAATIQNLIARIAAWSPLLKKLSELLYTGTHVAEIEARDAAEADWQAKERGYQQQLAVLQRQVDAANNQRQEILSQRQTLVDEITARDATIVGLQANADKAARQVQELTNEISAKEAAVKAESDDAALRSNL